MPAPKSSTTNANSASVEISTRDRIQFRLAESGFSDVQVRTDGDVALLSGYVDDEAQKVQAERIVKETPGVTSVKSLIVVRKKPPVNVNKPGGPRKN